MAEAAFAEVADRIYVLRYPVFDVNVTLLVGGEVAVVVDTLSTEDQASQLLAAVRSVTSLPLAIINTHDHFDHCFGNATLADASPGCGIWAHEATAAALRDHGVRRQHELVEHWRTTEPPFADALAAVAIRPPTRTVHTESIMDIGGRILLLHHFGRAHTTGDLVVAVPDASVLLTGDLVEQGAPPGFDDSFPLDWPETLSAMLHLVDAAAIVVPGHGALVDPEFVRGQHAQLTELAWLIREGHADGATPEEVATRAPFDLDPALLAVRRGYAELTGEI